MVSHTHPLFVTKGSTQGTSSSSRKQIYGIIAAAAACVIATLPA